MASIGNNVPLSVLLLPHRCHLKTGKIFLGWPAEPDAFLIKPAAMTGADKDAFLFLVVQPTAQMGALARDGPRSGFPDKQDKIMLKNKPVHRYNLIHFYYAWLPGGAVAKKTEKRIHKQGASAPAQPRPGTSQKYPPRQGRLFFSFRISHGRNPSVLGSGGEWSRQPRLRIGQSALQ